MPKKRFQPEEIIGKLRHADVLLGQGKKLAELVKALGVTDETYYRWRQEYGRMTTARRNGSRNSSARTGSSGRWPPTFLSISSSSRRPPRETSEPLASAKISSLDR